MSDTQEAKKKILIVDDEANIVTYLETLLEDNGYETVSASDGNEALEKVRNEAPALVCLDITMPKKSGVGFYRDLKEDPALAGIPVVVVTAVTGYGGDPESFKEFISTRKQVPSPEGFVAKPIDQEKFLEIVSQTLSAAT
jgi:CheY-like chemotaxis protein